MNSFGHAVAAAWEREDPRFVLGAMLPDLGMLIGARLAPVQDGELMDGISHHHRTDQVFHELPAFRDWWKEAAGELTAMGLRRHSARAASHVAIELLLDGELAKMEEQASAFLSALQGAAAGPRPRWRRPPERSWSELLERLSEAGVPHHLREAEAVSRRIEGALRRRPRLRLEGREPEVLTTWTRGVVALAGRRARLLAGELRPALSSQRSGTPGTSIGTAESPPAP
jgi:hypothetical protein